MESFCHFWDCIQLLHFGLLLTMRAPLLLRDSCPQQQITWSSELNLPISVHFSSLIPKMSMFTLIISCLTRSNLPWFMDLTFQLPMQYCCLNHWTLLSPADISTTGEGGDRGWDGWVAPLTQWIQVWGNSGRQWRTGKPGMLQFMTPQRVGHDLVTEQQQQAISRSAAFYKISYEVLPHQPYSPDLSATDYRFFKHFNNICREMLSWLAGARRCFPRSLNPEAWIFFFSRSMDFKATGINKLISHWQKCVDCNGSYFE